MTGIRTLPIRVAPMEGEALDSWLEALAHRTHTAWGDLLAAVGLDSPDGTATPGWLVHLLPEQTAALSVATGVAADTVAAMTLTRYNAIALAIDPATRTVDRKFPWSRTRGSRYCPHCLADTGGRWQLTWRLGWSFACLQHRCLLADACPKCEGVPRQRPHPGDGIPRTGRCATPGSDATGRNPARCGGQLAGAVVAEFPEDHPVLAAQRRINTIIDTGKAEFGVYTGNPQPCAGALADIRALAGRILTYATPDDLERIVALDLLRTYQEAAVGQVRRGGPARTDDKPGLAAPARAATAALGVTVALDILSAPDMLSAGDRMGWLVTTARDRGLSVNAANIGWGSRSTPVLTAVQLAALGPLINPSDQLRYRTASSMPGRPVLDSTRNSHLARRTPTMLWPAWSLRFAIPNCHQRQLRPALSIALLLVDTRLRLQDAAKLLDSPITGNAASRVLQLLARQDRWPQIRTALLVLADYLTDGDIPIDYQRRRQLDYTGLLPDATWARICRDTGTPGGSAARARIARCYLFERLSGRPASAAPFVLDESEFRTKTANFPQHLTPELAAALREHAHDFLARHHIVGEPALWEPATDLLDSLRLPGPDLGTVDVTGLHGWIRDEDHSLGEAANHLGTTLDAVRHVLDTHPVPAPQHLNADQARARGRAYYAAKSALPRDEFLHLYTDQQISLHDIAARAGVSRQTVARIARDYDIPLREPHRQARRDVDRDWLYNQYVTKRRALPDIARECGMSTANMARWAKTHDIPMRPRGGPSHSANLTAGTEAHAAPDILRPALAGIGGWERLQRFTAASRHPTMTIAAEELGVHQFTLVNQINRLERELDQQLLVRAERGRPMELTPFGAKVIGAVNACSKLRHPEVKAPISRS